MVDEPLRWHPELLGLMLQMIEDGGRGNEKKDKIKGSSQSDAWSKVAAGDWQTQDADRSNSKATEQDPNMTMSDLANRRFSRRSLSVQTRSVVAAAALAVENDKGIDGLSDIENANVNYFGVPQQGSAWA